MSLEQIDTPDGSLRIEDTDEDLVMTTQPPDKEEAKDESTGSAPADASDDAGVAAGGSDTDPPTERVDGDDPPVAAGERVDEQRGAAHPQAEPAPACPAGPSAGDLKEFEEWKKSKTTKPAPQPDATLAELEALQAKIDAGEFDPISDTPEALKAAIGALKSVQTKTAKYDAVVEQQEIDAFNRSVWEQWAAANPTCDVNAARKFYDAESAKTLKQYKDPDIAAAVAFDRVNNSKDKFAKAPKPTPAPAPTSAAKKPQPKITPGGGSVAPVGSAKPPAQPALSVSEQIKRGMFGSLKLPD